MGDTAVRDCLQTGPQPFETSEGLEQITNKLQLKNWRALQKAVPPSLHRHIFTMKSAEEPLPPPLPAACLTLLTSD